MELTRNLFNSILGAIFSENSTDLDEKIFKFAVDSINKQGLFSNITLNYSVKYAALDNSYENIYSGKCKHLSQFAGGWLAAVFMSYIFNCVKNWSWVELSWMLGSLYVDHTFSFTSVLNIFSFGQISQQKASFICVLVRGSILRLKHGFLGI